MCLSHAIVQLWSPHSLFRANVPELQPLLLALHHERNQSKQVLHSQHLPTNMTEVRCTLTSMKSHIQSRMPPPPQRKSHRYSTCDSSFSKACSVSASFLRHHLKKHSCSVLKSSLILVSDITVPACMCVYLYHYHFILITTSFFSLTVLLQTFCGQHHHLIAPAKEKTIHVLHLLFDYNTMIYKSRLIF